jgi:release factor glutamine methyltransferase
MNVNIQTLKDIRSWLTLELEGIYPEQEIIAITNLILKTQFGIERLHLLTDSGRKVTTEMAIRVIEICNELKTGKPVQYVLGETSFYNCIIKVSEKILIPRPETEEMVNLVIKENIDFTGRLVDFGTGSGCIAIALKKVFLASEVTGIDISEEAIEIASSNAILNGSDVSFIKGDILNFDTTSCSKADIIVSNPPYVTESEKIFMHRNILDFEPHDALFVTNEDPLIFYKAILDLSLNILNPEGRLYFEINERFGDETRRLMNSKGFSEVMVVNDINGKNRIVKGRLNG